MPIRLYYRFPDEASEDYSCQCCDLFYRDHADRQLFRHWSEPHLLFRDLTEIIEAGYARFCAPHYHRLCTLKGAAVMQPMRDRIERQARIVLEDRRDPV